MNTAEKIIAARNAAGMSRPQLAGAIGLSPRTLEKIEQGVVAEPKLADVVKIAIALGMSVNDFVADPPPPVAQGTKSKR